MKVGDVVCWISQSHGNKIKKTGKVLLTIKAGQRPVVIDGMILVMSSDSCSGDYPPRTRGRLFNGERLSKPTVPRNHKSYLIEVQDTLTGKPKLYWPKVNWLLPTMKGKK